MVSSGSGRQSKDGERPSQTGNNSEESRPYKGSSIELTGAEGGRMEGAGFMKGG